MKVWEKVKDFLMPEETIELDDLEDTMVAAEEPKAVVNGPVYSAPQSFVKPEPVVPKTPKPEHLPSSPRQAHPSLSDL